MNRTNGILSCLFFFSFTTFTIAQSDYGQHGRINMRDNSAGNENIRSGVSSGSGSSSSGNDSRSNSLPERTTSNYSSGNSSSNNNSSSNSWGGGNSNHSSSSSNSNSSNNNSSSNSSSNWGSDSNNNNTSSSNTSTYNPPSTNTSSGSTYYPSTYNSPTVYRSNNYYGNSSYGNSSKYEAPTYQANTYEGLERMESNWLKMHDKYITGNQDVKPTFEGVDVPFQTFKVDATKGGKIQLDNGGSIDIPRDAFVDKNDNFVGGEVELKYREFHHAADIIAAGIPMHDPKTGQYMETAGMFELKGEKAGSPINIASGKDLKVRMASSNEGNNFDFWKYDETNKTWEEIDGAGQIPAQRNNQKQRSGATAGSSSNKVGGDANPNSTTPSSNPNFSPDYTRTSSVNGFGLHNWDALRGQISRTVSTKQVEIIFDKESGVLDSDYSKIPFFWITRDGRSVVTYTNEEVRYANFTPYSNDVLVAILPDNRVATFTGRDFGRLDQSAVYLPYQFKTHPEKIASLAEFTKLLGY